MQFSIIKFSKVREGLSCRFDAEYFHPTAILYENSIIKLAGRSIKDFGCKVVSGPFGSSLKSDAYLKEGIPFIRISDLNDFIVDESKLIYISKEDHKRLSSSLLKIGDLILSKVGNTIGVVSIITENIGECNISENNIGIKIPSKISYDEKIFILTFLNSTPGQSQILRCISGNAQPKLNVSDIENIIIPHFSYDYIKIISNIVTNATQLINKSKIFYSQADHILLTDLNLLNWMPKHLLSFVKNYSDTKTISRIDAEYFQPMYEEVVKKLFKYKKGYGSFNDFVNVKDKNFTPKDNVVYKYIELANISNNGNITGFTEEMGKELPTRARRKVNTGDVIVSSIEGSLESIALINGSLNNALCSTGFYVVNSEKLNSETLLLFLKSKAGQLQLKKGCSGTILTAISKDELARIIIPKIDGKIQLEIKSKIKKMYQTKALSNNLLDIAKRGVEQAIEKDEKTAKKWIDTELKRIGIKNLTT